MYVQLKQNLKKGVLDMFMNILFKMTDKFRYFVLEYDACPEGIHAHGHVKERIEHILHQILCFKAIKMI
jgi:hypothetical protein